jgi:hypothetical protein
MLASITITPGNGLVANKYMPVTNPASPTNNTPTSRTPGNLVSKQALRVHAKDCWWGAARALDQGLTGIEP